MTKVTFSVIRKKTGKNYSIVLTFYDYFYHRSMRVDLDRDYESKYSSLRKEKDKDRHRKDPRDYRRDDYYYGRR